jgi:lipoate-protein ligase A
MRDFMNLDADLLEQVRAGTPWAYRSWEPDQVLVVLGRGNQADFEVYGDRCQADRAPIVRRRGGGGTVVLSPGVLVISLVKRVKQPFGFQEYFQQINALIMAALQSLGIGDLSQQGHSDICIRDRKILGASMYRSKDLLFYSASLMVANSLDLIDWYLKHPSKEPEYRRGRSHQDFLTTISQEYAALTVDTVKASIDRVLLQRIPEIE